MHLKLKKQNDCTLRLLVTRPHNLHLMTLPLLFISILLAVVVVATMVQNRETVLLAKRRATITAAMLHPAQGVQLASKKEPVVYYYMPEDKAAAHSSPLKKAGRAEEPFHLLQLAAANSTKLVCTEDNIKALAGTVQAAWSACKADADNYKGAEKWLTPNKDAKRLYSCQTCKACKKRPTCLCP